MADEYLLFERHHSVAHVVLNRPGALNAFDTALRLDLLRRLQAVAADVTVRVVVLSGSGRAFGAGADLRAGLPDGAELRRQLLEEYCPAVECIAAMPKPVVTAVEGFATGVAAAHVLASDLTVMAADAFLMLPFMNIALVPDGGLSWLLERRLGGKRAFELAVEGERLPAGRCQELGLANRVVAKGAAVAAALEWAQQLAARPALALAGTKQLLRAAPGRSLAQMQAMEADLQARCRDSADCREGVAAFLEKRAPKFG